MTGTKKKIALISNDKVGQTMAGPGIRYFEMAKALSKFFDVVLFVPDQCDLHEKDFKIKTYNSKKISASVGKQLSDINYVIAQHLRPPLLHRIVRKKIKFIFDLYDPSVIETLEYAKSDPPKLRDAIFDFNYFSLLLQLNMADHIICASERQKDFYFGLIASQKIITPSFYENNSNCNNLISLLPFGIPEEKPRSNNPDIFSSKFKNINSKDKIVYWGGGIWNWFDPISVIKAIENIAKKRTDIKLFFLGTKHPNEKIKNMEMTDKAIDYAKQHNLIDKSVFFNFGWTPYEERVDYLLGSTMAISCHFDNLETRFSFRTRVLDYIYAGLPMILTEGDGFAELIKINNLGRVVDFENISQLEKAIVDIADDNKLRANMTKNIDQLRSLFYWENVVKNLVKLIDENKISNNPKFYSKLLKLSYCFYYAGIRKKLFK